MCVCVCVHVCEHMWCALVCVSVCVCVCMCVYVRVPSVYKYVCVLGERERREVKCVCMHVCVCARVSVCVCVPVYMRVCMHACSGHIICLVNGVVNRCISGSEGEKSIQFV